MENKENYVATVPVEPPERHPGLNEAIVSIICGLLASFFFSVVFGPVGIIMGAMARKKGAKKLGSLGIIISASLMTFGLVFWIASLRPEA